MIFVKISLKCQFFCFQNFFGQLFWDSTYIFIVMARKKVDKFNIQNRIEIHDFHPHFPKFQFFFSLKFQKFRFRFRLALRHSSWTMNFTYNHSEGRMMPEFKKNLTSQILTKSKKFLFKTMKIVPISIIFQKFD